MRGVSDRARLQFSFCGSVLVKNKKQKKTTTLNAPRWTEKPLLTEFQNTFGTIVFFFFVFFSLPPVCIQAASSHAAVSMAISICVRNSLTLSRRSCMQKSHVEYRAAKKKGCYGAIFDRMLLFMKRYTFEMRGSESIFGFSVVMHGVSALSGQQGIWHEVLTFELKQS